MKSVGKVRAAVLDWLGIPIRLTDTDFWSQFAGGASTSSGQSVNTNTVLSLSAAWACTRLISETIATLPLKLYEHTSTGSREAVDHPLYGILTVSPNVDTTATVHWESTIASMLLRGAAWWERILFNGKLIGVNFLASERLTRRKISPGLYAYSYRDPRTDVLRPISQSNIVYIPGFSLDGINGVSVVEYGANVFGNALAADQSAGTTFKNGMMPTVYAKTERLLKQNQRDEFRIASAKVKGSMNAGEMPLLEGGMSLGTIGIDPKAAQLLETRGYGAAEICSWFRTPAWMVGVANGNQTKWGSGLEQELIAFLTFTLRPWLTRVSQSVMKDLLTPAERIRYFTRYDVRELLYADSAARSAFYAVMVDHGLMTRDEVREMENLDTKGGNADKLTVQLAMTTLDKLGEPADPSTKQLAMLAQMLGGSHEAS